MFWKIRRALYFYEAISAWRTKPTSNIQAEKAWYANNQAVMKVMNYIWLNELDKSIDG